MLLAVISALSALSAIASCIGSRAGLHSLWLAPVSFVGSFLGLTVLFLLFLLFLAFVVDQSKPQKHDSPLYRTTINLFVEFALTVTRTRIHTRGLEQTPPEGRFLLVCNHIHDIDPAILIRHFPTKQLAFITKKEVADMFFVGPMTHKIMCQPLNRENDKEALKTILNCIRLLKEDEVSIAVFPEGYIKPDRKLRHFRSGVFKIAMKTKVPIVVCTLQNTQYAVGNILHLKPTDVHLHLLKTIYPEEYAELSTVELGDKVYQMMAEDLGPDLVAAE